VPSSAAALDRSLAGGVAWVGATRLLGQAVSWASTLVVARLLVPADYAIVGMAGWLLGLLQLLTEFGIGAAIVARQRTEPQELRQLNGFAVLTGVGGTVVLACAAPLVAAFFREPRLVPVVMALSVVFTVSAFRTVPLAVLQRDLRFARLAKFDGIQSVALATLTVLLAWRGFGYWALVAASCMSAGIGTLLAVTRAPIGFAWPDLRRLRGTLTFSADVVAQRLCWYGYSNADFLVAGRVLGAGPMGVYSFAWGLSHIVIDKVGAVVMQVTPPVLARAQHDRPLLRRYFMRISGGLAAVCLPLMCGLALVAEDFVALALGPRWAATVPVLQVLCGYAAVLVVSSVAGQLLLVVGEERFGTRSGLLQLLVLPVLFWVGARQAGVIGIALVWVLVNPLFVAAQIHRVLRAIGLGWRAFLREALLPPVAGVAVMAVAVLAVRTGLLALGTPQAVRFALCVATGGLAYAATIWLGFRGPVEAAVQFLRQLRGGGLAPDLSAPAR
jgi:PST family polysaccharide transporter